MPSQIQWVAHTRRNKKFIIIRGDTLASSHNYYLSHSITCAESMFFLFGKWTHRRLVTRCQKRGETDGLGWPHTILEPSVYIKKRIPWNSRLVCWHGIIWCNCCATCHAALALSQYTNRESRHQKFCDERIYCIIQRMGSVIKGYISIS